MRIAVTGGHGFIGGAVVRTAQHAGHEVMSFDRAQGGDVLGDLDLMVEFRPNTVIHLAGVLGTAELFDAPHNAVDVNIHGTLNILQFCAKYGAGYVGITMPDSSWANVYQATKLCSMRLATAWNRNEGVPVSHVRAFNAFGPGQKYGPGHPQKIIPTFAVAAWQNEPIPIWGDGLQTVDLVHSDDIAEMLVRAIDFGDDEIFDAGTGIPLTVRSVAETVKRMANSTSELEYHPMRRGEEENTTIVAKGAGWDLLEWHPTLDWMRLQRTVDSYK